MTSKPQDTCGLAAIPSAARGASVGADDGGDPLDRPAVCDGTDCWDYDCEPCWDKRHREMYGDEFADSFNKFMGR